MQTPQTPRTGAAAVHTAPTAGTGFDGINAAESFCLCQPPDGSIAAGPNHLVGVVNTAVKVWNKNGSLLLGPADLNAFFATNVGCPSDGFINADTDPSTDYDAVANRFVIEILSYNAFTNDSRICVAVSQTGDPTGGWSIYAIPVQDAGMLFDFPHIAIGSDAIYVSGNEFNAASAFNGVRIYALNKSVLYAGQTAQFRVAAVGNGAAGTPADTLYPTRNVTTPNVMYFVGADNGTCPCSKISVWRWANALAGGAITLQGGVDVVSYAQPPTAVQPAGANPATIESNDARTLGAQVFNGSVYSAHTIGCNPGAGTVACIQWYQLGNIDGPPALVQQGVLGGDGEDRFIPNLSVDRSGNMTIGYAFSSASVFAGVRYTGRLASDAPGTLQLPEATLKAGEINMDGTRFGDFAGDVVDPDGCTIWHLEEYARAGAMWGTWVGSARFDACGLTPDFSVAATPASQSVNAGAGASYSVALTAQNGYASPVNLSVGGLPAGATGSFSPSSVTTSGTATLTVATTTSTPAGSYPLTITAAGADAAHTTHTAGVTLVVVAPDFTLSASPATLSLVRSASGNYTVTVRSTNGFSAPVALSVSGLPADATASFTPAAPTPPANGSVTSTLRVTAGRTRGTFTLRIAGVSGGLTHTSTVTLRITR